MVQRFKNFVSILMIVNVVMMLLAFMLLTLVIFIYLDPSLYTESLKLKLINVVGSNKADAVETILHEYWVLTIDNQEVSLAFLGGTLLSIIFLDGIGILLGIYVFIYGTVLFDVYVFPQLQSNKFYSFAKVSYAVIFLILVCLGILLVYSTCQINYNPFVLFSNVLETKLIDSVAIDKQEIVIRIFDDYWKSEFDREYFSFYFTNTFSIGIFLLAFIGLIICVVLCLSKNFETPKNLSDLEAKSRLIYVLLVLFLFGSLGVHNFYVGRTKQAVIQLMIGLIGYVLILPLLITGIWAIAEAITVTKDGQGRSFVWV